MSYHTHFNFFPTELLPSLCSYLPLTQWPQLRAISKTYQTSVDHCSFLQTRIAHLFLTKMAHRINIPFGDIYYEFDNKLIVKINYDLNVIHVIKGLAPVLSWINQLTLHQCGPTTILPLLKQLQNSPSLTQLILSDCTLDADCESALQRIMPPILTGETSINCKNKLKWNSEKTLKTFDSLEKTTQMKIVNSIWYSVLMDPKKDIDVSTDCVVNQVRKFIEDHPHHPALPTL